MEETGQSNKEVLAVEDGSRELCLALEERPGCLGRKDGGEGMKDQLKS